MTSAAPAVQVVTETEIVLRDGSTVHVRPATTDDIPRLRAFLAALSDESRWFRFFSAGVNLDAAARRAADPDEGSLCRARGAEGTVVGHGTYFALRPAGRRSPSRWPTPGTGHGIATVLIAHLAHAASVAGVDTFTATVLSENRRMLRVFHDSGFPVSSRREEGEIALEFPTSLSHDARGRFEERQRAADVAAVAHVLRPSSVAVIGASGERGSIGGEVARNLRAAGFPGSLSSPAAERWPAADRRLDRRRRGRSRARCDRGGRRTRSSPSPDAARRKGVRALVVLTASGPRPVVAWLQDELLAVCRSAGMRMVGPDSLGVANLCAETALDATFAPVAPPPGNVGFAGQSGGFGIAAIDAAAARGIGFSSFVAMGDKADLSATTSSSTGSRTPTPAVVLLYLIRVREPAPVRSDRAADH